MCSPDTRRRGFGSASRGRGSLASALDPPPREVTAWRRSSGKRFLSERGNTSKPSAPMSHASQSPQGASAPRRHHQTQRFERAMIFADQNLDKTWVKSPGKGTFKTVCGHTDGKEKPPGGRRDPPTPALRPGQGGADAPGEAGPGRAPAPRGQALRQSI